MPKLIGIKELQMNTRSIRENVAKGVSFIVIYRSKPVFEIHPVKDDQDWNTKEHYELFEASFQDWNDAKDDNLFDESISL